MRALFLVLQVEIFTDTIAGHVNIVTNGGDGRQGQDGSNSRRGVDSLAKVWECKIVRGGKGSRLNGKLRE